MPLERAAKAVPQYCYQGRTYNKTVPPLKMTRKTKWFGIVAAAFCLSFVIRFSEPVDDRLKRAASKAAWSGDLRKLQFYRLVGVNFHEAIPGSPPIIISAAYTGQQKLVSYLLATGVSPEMKDKYGGTALSRAAQYGHIETVELLLNAGVDANVKDNEGGNTPIDLCFMNAEQNHFVPDRIIELIATNGGQPNTTNYEVNK